jgi:hypothetical protein
MAVAVVNDLYLFFSWCRTKAVSRVQKLTVPKASGLRPKPRDPPVPKPSGKIRLSVHLDYKLIFLKCPG